MASQTITIALETDQESLRSTIATIDLVNRFLQSGEAVVDGSLDDLVRRPIECDIKPVSAPGAGATQYRMFLRPNEALRKLEAAALAFYGKVDGDFHG